MQAAAPENDRRLKVLAALRRRQAALRPPAGPFAGFAEKYFRIEELYDRHSIDSEYDFFIAGSDQVWNVEITGFDPFWFLDFAFSK